MQGPRSNIPSLPTRGPRLLITRLLLGLCESGFIPAGLYTITRWYKNEETSKRFAWYFVGNGLAQACSGLIAYGVLQMRGISGLAGWQWLFILEGILTLVVGVVFALLFPASPRKPVNLLGRRYFNEKETYILVQRMLLDDQTKEKGRKNVTGAELRATVCTILLILLGRRWIGC
jgi:MFS family permease